MDPAEIVQLLARRKASLEAFEDWERRQPTIEFGREVFARLAFLNSLLPRDARTTCADPEYAGVRYMQECLSCLGKFSC